MLVIGNGESRIGLNLSKNKNVKIGCNAIQRDFIVEHLVCVDRRMVKEAIDANYQGNIYTRSDWANNYKNVDTVPALPYKGKDRWDEPFQWGSGPYAVLLGALLSTNVEMIGFDLYSNTTNVNNVYKSTKGYDDYSKKAVDPRYWIHQIGKVFECFPDTRFTVYNNKHWKMPKTWKFSNVSLDKISKFV